MVKRVELVYVPQNLPVVHQTVPFVAGMTVADVLECTGLVDSYPEVAQLSVGVYSHTVTREYCLQPGDRVELYRPLVSCPKEKRRKRAINRA
jgi:putative ubiquitin-RnfH superfamily antitoxin RatB of RatAB toxin-antitoxin module